MYGKQGAIYSCSDFYAVNLDSIETILFLQTQITLPDSDAVKRSQESLMNDFLMIDFLQKDIISILMRKIKTLAVDE